MTTQPSVTASTTRARAAAPRIDVRATAPLLPRIAFVLLGLASLLGTALSNRGLGVPLGWLVPRWLALWSVAVSAGFLAWRVLYLRDAAGEGLAATTQTCGIGRGAWDASWGPTPRLDRQRGARVVTTATPQDRPAPLRRSTSSRSAREVVLDNRQVPCALGLFRLRDRMAALAPGGTVVVRSRDRFAPIEIPLWAERAGHEVVDVDRVGLWPLRTHRITVRHGGA